ncbi:hypothetical protein Golax_005812 [Gossypium laxum]|uniref:Inactive poly [ADP-ribose] polymerase SRO2 n=1 Tax=Gossypium laxum TaxID=34288 RepID=A0A7J9A215_9ROSI|nr:hypothetical protein [Gossypium laxum]
MNQIGAENQTSITIDDAMSESNELDSCYNCFQHFVTNGFSKIDESSFEGDIIKTSFFSSLSRNPQISYRTKIVAIHKNSNTSQCWKIRAHSFGVYAKAVADTRGGDANIKYAWYGASKNEICETVMHGFSWRRHSISVSPAKHGLDSVLCSGVDGSGGRHLLLCRVILGKQEVVREDSSDQFHPSSMDFDSAVDDISSPTRYIIWNTHLNYNILPCYILSFEAPPYLSGLTEPKTIKPKTWITFGTLISILSPFLDHSQRASLEEQYTNYLEKNITRPQMIERVRAIAGNQLLSAVVKLYTNKVQFWT